MGKNNLALAVFSPTENGLSKFFSQPTKFFLIYQCWLREKKISRGKNYLGNTLLAHINDINVVKNSLFEQEKKGLD